MQRGVTVSDWKERMKRIKAANEGTYEKGTQPRKPKTSQKNHPSQTHSRLHRRGGEKTISTHCPLCDMCGKKTSRRNMTKMHGTITLCKTCSESKER